MIFKYIQTRTFSLRFAIGVLIFWQHKTSNFIIQNTPLNIHLSVQLWSEMNPINDWLDRTSYILTTDAIKSVDRRYRRKIDSFHEVSSINRQLYCNSTRKPITAPGTSFFKRESLFTLANHDWFLGKGFEAKNLSRDCIKFNPHPFSFIVALIPVTE